MANEEYKIRLVNIEIFSFNMKHRPLADFKINNFIFNVTVENRISLEQSLVIQVATIALQDRDDLTNKLAEISIAFGIFVENFRDVIKMNDEKKLFEVPEKLDLILKSITVSTSRGILYSRLMGTYLHNAILPIIPIPFPEQNILQAQALEEKIVASQQKTEEKIRKKS